MATKTVQLMLHTIISILENALNASNSIFTSIWMLECVKIVEIQIMMPKHIDAYLTQKILG